MTVTRDEKTGLAGADVVAELKASGALDDLFARIDSGQIELTGDGGMIPALVTTSEVEQLNHGARVDFLVDREGHVLASVFIDNVADLDRLAMPG